MRMVEWRVNSDERSTATATVEEEVGRLQREGEVTSAGPVLENCANCAEDDSD
jgi:hypothetical protein